MDAKKRKSGEDGSFPFDSFDAVVDAIGAAVKSQRIVAQRATVTSWLSSRGLRFIDARMASDGSSVVAFSAKLGDGAWGAEPAAACEVLLRGVHGVRLTVRGLPRAPSVRRWLRGCFCCCVLCLLGKLENFEALAEFTVWRTGGAERTGVAGCDFFATTPGIPVLDLVLPS